MYVELRYIADISMLSVISPQELLSPRAYALGIED